MNDLVVIGDDTEILGSGVGSVKELVLDKLKRILPVLIDSDIRMTFFIDAAHLLFSELYEQENNEYRYWLDSLDLLFSSGMDVQFHFHPQWIARIKNSDNKISEKWNIGEYSESDIETYLLKAKLCLERIGNQYEEGYRVKVYKTGSWGLQPFDKTLPILKDLGFEYVVGGSSIMVSRNRGIDYRNLGPLVCEDGFIHLHGLKIILLPLASYSLFDLLLVLIYKIGSKNKIQSDKNFSYQPKVRSLVDLKINQIAWFRMYTHIRLNWQPAWWAIRGIRNCNNPIPIVETHTKDFGDREFNKFIESLTKKGYKILTYTDWLYERKTA